VAPVALVVADTAGNWRIAAAIAATAIAVLAARARYANDASLAL